MNDDERTRVFGSAAGGPAPDPDPMSGPAHATNRLPVGTRFGEFEIVGVVGEGGFGIVYLALDHALDYRVAIKEYMPSSIAFRASDGRVTVKSDRMGETFEAGLRSFVTEAKLLAQFDHPSLLKAFRLWEANGTAYMAMRFYEGITLKEALRRLGAPPTEPWLRRLLAPLLDAVETMHAERVYHRDIAPDNILILPDGRPVLLDFGAARRVIGDMTQALTVILKPGFAPIEQYAEMPDLSQGPWTDVYALAAVIHYAISGRTPLPSVSRLMKDSMAPAREVGAGRFPDAFLDAIDRALSVRPDQRPASIAQFRTALGLAPRATHDPSDGFGVPPPMPQPVADPWPAGAPSGAGAVGAPSILDPGFTTGAGGGAPQTASGGPASDPFRASASGSGTTRRGPGRLLAGAALAVVAVALAGGLGTLLYRYTAPPAPMPAAGPAPGLGALPPTTETASSPPASPAPVPEPGRAAASVAPGPAPSARPASPPQANTPVQPAPLAPPRPPFSPTAVLDALEEGRAADRPVRARPSQPTVRVGGRIGFTVRSERDGYLYVLLLGTDPSHFYLLFPNAFDDDNRIRGGMDLTLPRRPPGRGAWELAAAGDPPGTNRFIAIVTDQPRDFGDLGLVRSEAFGEFDQSVMRRRWDEATDLTGVLSGRAACAPGSAGCDLAYGAARFQIEELPR